MARPTDRPTVDSLYRTVLRQYRTWWCGVFKVQFFKTETSERIQNVLYRYYQLYCRKNDAIELKKMSLEHKNK